MNQILSQEEVNALLEGVTSGEVEVGDKASSQESKEADKEAELYNFRDQEQRIMGKLGSLSNIQEKFAQNFKNSLTIDLSSTFFAHCSTSMATLLSTSFKYSFITPILVIF